MPRRTLNRDPHRNPDPYVRAYHALTDAANELTPPHERLAAYEHLAVAVEELHLEILAACRTYEVHAADQAIEQARAAH